MSEVRGNKQEAGFTLIEVILALTIAGIISISIYNVNLFAWNFWSYNQDKVDLKQQARIITMYLEKDIKRATDIRLNDIDSDGNYDLLLLRFGDEGSNIRNDYRQYHVNDNKLAKALPEESAEDEDLTDLGADNWPLSWSSNTYITREIIDSYEFDYVDGNKELIYFNFELIYGEQSYTVENKIHPRILK